MPEGNRIVSQPLELHPLSIVERNARSEVKNAALPQTDEIKSEQVTENGQLQSGGSPRRAGMKLSLPVEPTRNGRRPVPNDEQTATTGDDNYQRLLFKFAEQKRKLATLQEQIVETKKDMKRIEAELAKYGNTEKRQVPAGTGSTGEMLQNWSDHIQKTIGEVNSSPNVIRGKQSLTGFFHKSDNNGNKTSAATSEKPFFHSLIQKFNEFAMNEDEEEEFDKQQKPEHFFVKDDNLNYEYDDENIEDEEEVEGILKLNAKRY